jgi:hypothetical protein
MYMQTKSVFQAFKSSATIALGGLFVLAAIVIPHLESAFATGQHGPAACEVSTQTIISDTSVEYINESNTLTPTVEAYDENIFWSFVDLSEDNAVWVWPTYNSDPNGETQTLKKEFTLNGDTPLSGTIQFAADNTYRFFVNGSLVQESSLPDNFTSLTEVDITSYLQAGTNVFTWEITNIGDDFNDPTVNPAGLLFVADITSQTCPTVTTCTTDVYSDTRHSTYNPTRAGAAAVATYAGNPSWTANVGNDDAIWIWSDEFVLQPRTGENQWFARTFVVTGDVTEASATVAADNGYEMYINGVLVGADPDSNDVDPYNFTLAGQDSYTDLDAYLNTGVNTISFKVHNRSSSSDDATVNPAGLLYSMTIHSETWNETCEPLGDFPPILTVIPETITVNVADGYDGTDIYLDGVFANDFEDGDITDNILVSGDTVDLNTNGTYEIDYSVTDSDNNSDTGERTVIVEGNLDYSVCVFEPQDNRTIVEFNNDRLLANQTLAKATGGTYSVNLPGGKYKISLQSYDGYANRVNVSQPKEQYALDLSITTGAGAIARTNPTDDLADNVASAYFAGVVTEGAMMPSGIADVTPVHAFYTGSGNPNSVEAVCAAFDKIEDNGPTNTKPVITVDPTTITVTVGTSVDILDGVTADDNEDGDITTDIVTGGDTVDINTVGTYTVTYDVQDSEGLSADQKTRTIEVEPVPYICSLEFVSEPGTTFADAINGTPVVAAWDDSSAWTADEVIDTATWVWKTEYSADSVNGETIEFFRTISIPGDIVSAQAEVGADNRYKLFVNGTQVSSDDIFASYYNFQAENVGVFDITDELSQGENALRFYVRQNSSSGFGPTTNPAGLIYRVAAQYESTAPCDTPINNAPVITVDPETITITVGDSVSVMNGVTADDVEDGDITGSITIAGDTVDNATVGTYVVTYNVTDSDGLSATEKTRTYNVVAEATNYPPVITVDPITVNLELGATTPDVLDGVTADDVEDGDITADLVAGGDTVDTTTAGTYVVTYDVTDSDGNDAVQKSRTYNVAETIPNTPPVITLRGDNPLVLNIGDTYIEPMADVDDAEDGDIDGNLVIGGDTVATDAPAIFYITYNAQDSEGLAATEKIRTVVVHPADQCFALAHVTIDEVKNWDNGDSTNTTYVGNDTDTYAQGAWFPIHWLDAALVDSYVEGYENVPGFVVERRDGSLRSGVYGSHGKTEANEPAGKEAINGMIEFYNATATDVSSDDSGNNKIEKGFDGIGVGQYNAGNDEISVAAFWLTVTTADDVFFTDYSLNCDIVTDNDPVITVDPEMVILTVGDTTPDVLDGVTADDVEDGDITADLVAGGDTVDTTTAGTYVVTYDVTDSDGNDAVQKSRTYEVRMPNGGGNLPPVITVNPETITVSIGTTVDILNGVTATDLEDGDVTTDLVTGGDTVDTNTLGTYTVTYDVQDSEGLDAVQKTRVYNVVNQNDLPECSDGINNDDNDDTLIDAADPDCHTDNDPNNPDSYDPNDDDEDGSINYGGPVTNNKPVIILDGDNPLQLVLGDTYTEPGAKANDVEDGNGLTVTDIDATDVDTTNLGTYSVYYNFKDSKGLAADQVVRTVVVGDVAGETTVPVYPNCTLRFNTWMNYGARGGEVADMQSFLNDHMDAGLVVDGIYGPKTAQAVGNFQEQYRSYVLNPWGLASATNYFYKTTRMMANYINGCDEGPQSLDHIGRTWQTASEYIGWIDQQNQAN